MYILYVKAIVSRVCAYKDWGCNGIDPRKVDGLDTNMQAKTKSMSSQEFTFTGWFLLFF